MRLIREAAAGGYIDQGAARPDKQPRGVRDTKIASVGANRPPKVSSEGPSHVDGMTSETAADVFERASLEWSIMKLVAQTHEPSRQRLGGFARRPAGPGRKLEGQAFHDEAGFRARKGKRRAKSPRPVVREGVG